MRQGFRNVCNEQNSSTGPWQASPEQETYRSQNGCQNASQNARLTLPMFPCSHRASAGLAQLVEHLICNQRVTGSSPVAGTIDPPSQPV